MKLAIVCGGKPQLSNETPLKFIKESVEKVVAVLKTNGWECASFEEASNTEDYKKILETYSSVEELLFYYIGHGTGSQLDTFEIHFQTNSLTVEQIIAATRSIHHPKKMALIIDACYSGNAIRGTINEDGLEILTSTDRDTQAFEDDNKKMSLFSHYFCKVFSNVVKENSHFINLKDIQTFVLSDKCPEIDDAYYLPPRTGLIKKIVIGNTQKTNTLKTKLFTYYQNNYPNEQEQIDTFRYDILRYYPRSKEALYNRLKEAHSLDALFKFLLQDEKGSYLYCLLKYLEIEDVYLDAFVGDKACKEIEGIIDTIIVTVKGSTNNNKFTADIYYSLDNGLVEHKADIDEFKWDVLYKIKIKEELEEILQLNCIAKMELQLILPIKLISSDFKNELVALGEVEGIVNNVKWGKQFNIITKFYSRLEDYSSQGNSYTKLWQDNVEKYGQYLEESNKSKTYCTSTLDNISNFCDNDALLLLSEQSAVDNETLAKICFLGIPFVVTSQEGQYIFSQDKKYDTWCNSKLKDVKKSSYRFINEIPQTVHFLCDDGYGNFFLRAFQNVDKNKKTDNFLGDEHE